jgi:multiple sugar transport system permease protein
VKPRRPARFFLYSVLPVLVLVSFLVVYPTIKGILMSFQNYTLFTLNDIHFVGFENYKSILTDSRFYISLWNTVLWIAGSVSLQFVLGFILALLMWKPFKGRGIYAGLVFYPWALSGFAIGLVWSWLLNGTFGVVNDILLKLHLIDQPIHFLSDPKWAMLSVIMVNVWYGIPFFAIMILAALQSIPQSVVEAAMIDGAGPFRRLFGIVIPYIRPTILSTLLLRVIWVMNFPDIIYGTTRGGPAGATEILSVYMINVVFYENDYSKAAAIGTIVLGILITYTLIYMKTTSYQEMEL